MIRPLKEIDSPFPKPLRSDREEVESVRELSGLHYWRRIPVCRFDLKTSQPDAVRSFQAYDSGLGCGLRDLYRLDSVFPRSTRLLTVFTRRASLRFTTTEVSRGPRSCAPFLSDPVIGFIRHELRADTPPAGHGGLIEKRVSMLPEIILDRVSALDK